MKLNFRQGIVSSYAAGLTPLFLAPSAVAGFVDLVVSPEPTVVAFAHAESDYLQAFSADVAQAWGPLVPGQDAYLYWEIDQLTANVLFKTTRYSVLVTATAPVAPSVDQHWFDLSTTTMKHWTGTKWLPKIAVFAGVVPSGAIGLLQPYGYGSQVGLNTPADAGFVMLSSLLKPIYTNPATFEFLTTTKSVRIKTSAGTSGVLATPPNAFIPVRASENIPAFSLVYFSGENTVGLASSNPALPSPRTPIGVVQVDLSTNEMGNVTQNGEIQWDQWDWSASIGQPLYCTDTGQITPIRPAGLLAYRVGFVKSSDTILFNVDAETQPQIYQASANDIIVNGLSPLSTSFSTNLIGERIWTVEISDATTSARGAMTAAQATLLGTHTTQIATNAADILTKAPLVHTHVIADTTGLQIALDGKSNVGHNHDLLYSQLGHNHDLVYSALGHAHIIGDVTGLQNALNLKADISHSHIIGDVTGLQGALDAKFTTATDFLPMAQVSGLASALALKSNVGHTHVIADVSNLQPSLDAKISFTNTTVFTPTAQYNPATKKYVDDAIAAGSTPLTAQRVAFGSATNTVTGSSQFTWNDTTSTMTLGTTDGSLSIGMPAIATTTSGATFSISGQRNDVGNGGDVVIFGGQAFQNNILYRGGHITLQAGGGTTGGDLVLEAGQGTGSVVGSKAGNTIVRSGSTGNGVAGGDTTITTRAVFPGSIPGTVFIAGALAVTAHNSRGGDVVVRGGNSGVTANTERAGHVTVEGGMGSTSGAGGNVTIQNGLIAVSSAGAPGAIIVRTGASAHTERLRVTADGEWQLAGNGGGAGEVLTSGGAGNAPAWTTIPEPPIRLKVVDNAFTDSEVVANEGVYDEVAAIVLGNGLRVRESIDKGGTAGFILRVSTGLRTSRATIDNTPATPYTQFVYLNLADGSDGDVGVKGYIGDTEALFNNGTPSFEISGALQAQTDPIPFWPGVATLNDVMNGVGFDGKLYVGGGLASTTTPFKEPMAIGTRSAMNTEYGYYTMSCVMPARVGDSLWVTGVTSLTYNSPVVITVTVGPSATEGEVYQLGMTGSDEPYSRTLSIERLANIGGRT